jgi:putative oxidoreductase
MTLSVSLGLLLLRIIVGLTIAGHGTQKLFGWFGGPGLTRQMAGFHGQGLRPGWLWSALVILGELGGGLSLIFGFLTPLGAAGIFAAMLMAIIRVHWKNGFWNSARGIEFPLSLLAAASTPGFTGPGAISLDKLFGITLPYPWLFLILAVIGVIVDIIGHTLARSASAPASAPPSTPAP